MTPSMSSLVDAGLVKEMAAPSPGHTKRRRIDPRTGKALVILSHAIDYLANEFVYEAEQHKPDRAQLDAISILIAKNCDLYQACPELPTIWQALRSLLHVRHNEPVTTSGLGSKLSHGGL